jgi:hypothetical protein
VEKTQGNITIGRDATGNIMVIGDHNKVSVTIFVADQRLLARFRPAGMIAETANPYRGLDAFYETDTRIFFGRSKLIRGAWIRFQTLQRGLGPRIMAIVGASGSGKSSFVRAGLVPELVRNPFEDLLSPNILVLRPGMAPFERMGEVLRRLPGLSEADVSILAEREFSAATIHGLLAKSAGKDRSRFLIVVDQFEELFTECVDSEKRRSFLDNLALASTEPDGLVSVLLTLRNDFASAVQTPPAFAMAVRQNRVVVHAIDREGLTESVARPARDLGQPWPPSFVDAFVDQAEGRAGALPLLQFALKQLWPEHVIGHLDEANWSSRLIEDFLVQAADTLFDMTEGVERECAQRIIRRAFLSMVQLGEGTPDTRRVARLSDFVANGEQPEVVRRVLAPFAAPEARLITTSEEGGEPTYELTHESLITSWDRLHAWLGNVPDKTEGEHIRAELRLRRRLWAASREWRSGTGGLWRPPELELLTGLLERSADELTSDEKAFAENSENEWHHHLEVAGRKERRLHVLFRAAQVLSVMLAVLAGVATWQWRLASGESQIALARQLAAQAEIEQERGNINRSALLAVESLRRQPSFEGDRALRRALRELGERTLRAIWSRGWQTQPSSHLNHATFSPDGKYLVTTGLGKSGRVIDALSGKDIADLGLTGAVHVVAFSSDARYLATESEADGSMTVQVFEAATWKEVSRLNNGIEGDAMALSAGGRYLALRSSNNGVRVIESATGKETWRWQRGNVLASVEFSSDNRYLAAGWNENDAYVDIFDLGTGKEVSRVQFGPILIVSFSPDGHYVAAGTVQDNVYVFETQTGKIVSVLSGGGLIQVVKFSPNGQYVAFSNPSNVVKVFEVSTGKESWQIDDAGSVEDLAFTANQSYIALACSMMKTGPSIATPKLSTIRVDEIPLRPAELIAQGCLLIEQNLSPPLWREYLGDERYRKTCPNLSVPQRIH